MLVAVTSMNATPSATAVNDTVEPVIEARTAVSLSDLVL